MRRLRGPGLHEALGRRRIARLRDGGDFLRDLGTHSERYWQDYLTELKEANASRLPAIPVGQWNPKA